MPSELTTPAQIRAARAMLDWSQDQLANEAGVAISSVRDVEGSKRDPEAQTIASIRRALGNAGIVFLTGNAKEGFGVRVNGNRPHILRRPTVMTMWEGMPFNVEWQGKDVSVFISREALDDLGALRGKASVESYIGVFDKHIGTILDGVAKAIADPENFDRQGHLHVRGRDLPMRMR